MENDPAQSPAEIAAAAAAAAAQNVLNNPQPQPEQPETVSPAHLATGQLVNVQPRTWPGINKQGGVGRITKVYTQNVSLGDRRGIKVTHVDVKLIHGGRENRVDVCYVNEYQAEEGLRDHSRQLGRCSNCGSLRIDCNSCDWNVEEAAAAEQEPLARDGQDGEVKNDDGMNSDDEREMYQYYDIEVKKIKKKRRRRRQKRQLRNKAKASKSAKSNTEYAGPPKRDESDESENETLEALCALKQEQQKLTQQRQANTSSETAERAAAASRGVAESQTNNRSKESDNKRVEEESEGSSDEDDIPLAALNDAAQNEEQQQTTERKKKRRRLAQTSSCLESLPETSGINNDSSLETAAASHGASESQSNDRRKAADANDNEVADSSHDLFESQSSVNHTKKTGQFDSNNAEADADTDFIFEEVNDNAKPQELLLTPRPLEEDQEAEILLTPRPLDEDGSHGEKLLTPRPLEEDEEFVGNDEISFQGDPDYDSVDEDEVSAPAQNPIQENVMSESSDDCSMEESSDDYSFSSDESSEDDFDFESEDDFGDKNRVSYERLLDFINKIIKEVEENKLVEAGRKHKVLKDRLTLIKRDRNSSLNVGHQNSEVDLLALESEWYVHCSFSQCSLHPVPSSHALLHCTHFAK
jgi:hypothetical protein